MIVLCMVHTSYNSEAVASEDNEIVIQCDTLLDCGAKESLVQSNFKDVKPGKDPISHDHASSILSDDQMKTDHQLVHSDTEEDKNYTRITDTVTSSGHGKQSKLELVGPEEELDMLLNSLGGTHLSSSNLGKSFGNSSTLEGTKVSESNEKFKASSSSKSLALAPLDDALDALLSETSLPVEIEGFAASSVTSRSTIDSDNNTDFRCAKQIDVTTSIDDSVDDLLADISFFLNDQKQTTLVQGQQNISNVSVPPHSGSSNVSADFDSWFDSL